MCSLSFVFLYKLGNTANRCDKKSYTAVLTYRKACLLKRTKAFVKGDLGAVVFLAQVGKHKRSRSVLCEVGKKLGAQLVRKVARRAEYPLL